ncbi:hypothetical protein K458DRAFT_487863 [Lentithecium fluviatile CBS 122367]|uniref:BTB/POZ domain-containing protein n=1 Tax=Lentithecium fluviatile CBS 122367 TaxID=1168545 RepID=A0A6G1IZS8_9PLEO|nr:hypothetical protein K458DRAFT_487863 [Lentithecium fluviatile CBS 122367]
MPDQSGHTTSRDFAFQTADQAYAHQQLGGEGAPHPAYTTQSHERYEAERAGNAHSGLATPDQGPALDPSMRYMDFGGQSNPNPQEGAQGQFPGYGFNSDTWDWGNSIDFPDFAGHYEPQGELVQELQNQNAPNDFSIPLPVTNTDTVHRSPQPTPGAPSVTIQNPLSPPPKPPQKPSVQTGMKRKADSEPNSAVSQNASSFAEPQQKPAKRPNKSRTSSNASATSPVAATSTAAEARPPPMAVSSSASTGTETGTPAKQDNETQKRKEPSKGTGPQGRVIDVSKPRRIVESPAGSDILPAGKVFPIQIGSELFRLSGASLSSDAPSYFSHFFGDQIHNNQGRAGDIRTLYIDRDPDTFRDIALHLQGYHVNPRDGEHFVRLFADAQFYSLPRLTKQLFKTDIFVRIGGTPFQIPRDLFSSPGDSPNYFSLGFAQFFSTPSEVFPGLDRNALLRPPSISPPSVPNRSGETFGELVKLLQGYNIEIRDDTHRSQLLRDARYFHLKGLEQKLIPCDISYNLKRGQSEILVRLDDIRQSGVSFAPDGTSSSSSGSGSAVASIAGLSPDPGSKQSSPAPSLGLGGPQFRPGTVCYARPYTDDHAGTNILILEVSSTESTILHLPIDPPKPTSSREPLNLSMRATFHGSTLARIASLFSVVASKMGLPATQPLGLMMLQSGGGVAAQPVSPANSGVSERRVRVRVPSDCHLEINNGAAELAVDPASGRMGIRHTYPAPQHKRIKMSEEQDGHGTIAGDTAKEWIWGGAREIDVKIGKDGEESGEELVVKRAHWRLRVEPVDGEGAKMQVVLCGVRLEGYSQEKSRNRSRGFLG